MKQRKFNWSLSNKGTKMLICEENYQYLLNKVKDGTSYFKCRKHKVAKCKATCVVKADSDVGSFFGEHEEICLSSKTAQKVSAIVAATVSRNSGDVHNPPRNVIADISQKVMTETSNAHYFMGSKDSIYMKLYRERKKICNDPQAPAAELLSFETIPQTYSKLGNGEDFLIHVGSVNGKKMLVFMSSFGKRVLSNANEYYGDGTFATAPVGFYQIYTIHGRLENESFPACYALLQSKESAMYAEFLKVIKAACGYQPDYLMIDFEMSMLDAIESVYEGTSVHGCLFHWKQCIFKQLTKKGCLRIYHAEEEFQRLIKLVYTLAFLPEADIIKGWEEVIYRKFEKI